MEAPRVYLIRVTKVAADDNHYIAYCGTCDQDSCYFVFAFC